MAPRQISYVVFRLSRVVNPAAFSLSTKRQEVTFFVEVTE